MSVRTFSSVKPFAEIIPDQGAPEGHRNPESVEQGAGTLVIGFEIDGARKVLFSGKAGGFLDDLARAEKSKKPAKSADSK